MLRFYKRFTLIILKTMLSQWVIMLFEGGWLDSLKSSSEGYC
jgi:uncharacterized membrane protein YjjP (DUF1212 family)